MDIEFKPTYLMIKRHPENGLLYFCKTVKTDPVKYRGSGKYWTLYINAHGRKKVETLWHQLFTSKEDLQEFALFFSDYFNIVDDEIWANLVVEDGITGWPPGTKHSKETIDKCRLNANGFKKGYTPFNKGGKMPDGFAEGQRKRNKTRMKAGTHNMLTSEFKQLSAAAQKKMFEEGTHPFSDVCGANNINYDPTIHTFTNKKTGMTVQMTQSEFVTKFNLSRQNVNAVIKGRRKSVSGWILENYSTYNYLVTI